MTRRGGTDPFLTPIFVHERSQDVVFSRSPGSLLRLWLGEDFPSLNRRTRGTRRGKRGSASERGEAVQKNGKFNEGESASFVSLKARRYGEEQYQ